MIYVNFTIVYFIKMFSLIDRLHTNLRISNPNPKRAGSFFSQAGVLRHRHFHAQSRNGQNGRGRAI